MRLLRFERNGDVGLVDFFGQHAPKYAILSHRWGAEEVTMKDLTDGTGRGKAGLRKILFCGEQARRDGLDYFWVDTCCMDKTNAVELQESINSMFRWYQNATKCYVYLPDVPRPWAASAAAFDDWASAFRKSTWFTRGWTLQELIAPASVEFYSQEEEPLGNKAFLEQHICAATGIPARALRETPLSDFSVDERMAWAARRETTRQEDKAYSLLGIFGVHMPLIYGEGELHAMQRLREEIEKDMKGRQHENFAVTFDLSAVWDVEHFVARKTELAEMRTVLSGDGSRRTVVLHGLGGIGKTQLAAAYAKTYKDCYSAIFWLNIQDENALRQSFVAAAKRIQRDHPSALRLSKLGTSQDMDEAVNAVKEWLCLPHNTRWLLIYDNYDNPKLPRTTDPAAVNIRTFLPGAHHGFVVITTRSSEVRIGHTIRIQKLGDVQASLEMLSSVARRPNLPEDPAAVALAQELDGLPLALATAGAYLDQTGRSCSDYLRLYRASWNRLMTASPGPASYEDRTLYSTWQVSFDSVQQQNRLAARLLQFWAYFDSQDLWYELLCHGRSEDPGWVHELTEDEVSFDSAVRVLSNHGFVEVAASPEEGTGSRGYSIHGCVHSWTVHVLNQQWDEALAEMAVRFVAAHLPDWQAHRPWVLQRRLLQHAARCSYMLSNGKVGDNMLADEYNWLGGLYRDQDKLADAEQMYQQALQSREKALGPDHTSTLETIDSLGIIYEKQGKLAEAEQMYRRALQGFEKALGPDHTLTLGTVNSLGVLYRIRSKLDEAEQMFRWALQGSEKALGPDHAMTLKSGVNLGVLYIKQNKLTEAEQMFRRALQGFEKASGPDHTMTLITVLNLGALYIKQDKLTEAEQMFRWALQGFEKALGPDHTTTLDTVNNLGVLYRKQGKLAEAEQMFRRALQGYEKALGPGHRKALNAVNNLGGLYTEQGRLAEAEQMYQRAL